MSLSASVLNQLKKSTLSPSANKKLQKKGKTWVDTNIIHVPISKYKSNDEKKDDNIFENKSFKSITIVHISDTHNKHNRMRQLIPNGDILIHSGDFVSRCFWNNISDKQSGNIKNLPNEIYEFNEWIGKLPHKYKIVIGGNHECCFNQLTNEIISNKILTNCIYLQDSYVIINGLKIYGTPWTSCGSNWGFGTNGFNNNLYNKWNIIPSDTDILITHQPPYGIFDIACHQTTNILPPCNVKKCNKKIHNNESHWGCLNLLSNIKQRIKPYIHLYGHVHDDVG
eukprot:555362_1